MAHPVKPWHRGLSRAVVASAALDVLDADGHDALTMRRVAAELDVTAPAIYAHVTNKEDLLDAALDLVLAGVTVPAPGADARAGLVEGFSSYRQAFLEHPGAARLVTQRSRLSAEQVRLVEGSVRLFVAAGLDLTAAVGAHVTTIAFTIGFIAQEVGRPSGPPPADLLAEASYFRDIAAALGARTVDERFRVGLAATIDGALAAG